MLQQCPTDCVLREKVQEIRKVALNLSETERKFFFQRAKCGYIISSDQNT